MPENWPDIWVSFATVSGPENYISLWAALIGTVVGGAISFGTTSFFQFSQKRKEENLNDFALYLLLNEIVSDVYAFGSMYHRQLGETYWPLRPSRSVNATLSRHSVHKQIPTHLLACFRGKHAEGLTQAALELT